MARHRAAVTFLAGIPGPRSGSNPLDQEKPREKPRQKQTAAAVASGPESPSKSKAGTEAEEDIVARNLSLYGNPLGPISASKFGRDGVPSEL